MALCLIGRRVTQSAAFFSVQPRPLCVVRALAAVAPGDHVHPLQICRAGLLLPILGALPDSLIIIVSGLGGTLAEAQEQVGPCCTSSVPGQTCKRRRGVPPRQRPCWTAAMMLASYSVASCVSPAARGVRRLGAGTRVQSVIDGTVLDMQVAVGVGTLAGSTIMLLTIAWGGSVWAGRCDIGPSVSAWYRRAVLRRSWSWSLARKRADSDHSMGLFGWCNPRQRSAHQASKWCSFSGMRDACRAARQTSS